MNTIEKVIEEWEKEFDKLSLSIARKADKGLGTEVGHKLIELKSHLSTTISNILDAVDKEVEGKKFKDDLLHDGDVYTPVDFNEMLESFQALLKSAKESIR